jgi:hypothetical protein
MSSLSPRLQLKVAQKQILTPSLVQMVKVLQLNRLELREMIDQEIAETRSWKSPLNGSPPHGALTLAGPARDLGIRGMGTVVRRRAGRAVNGHPRFGVLDGSPAGRRLLPGFGVGRMGIYQGWIPDGPVRALGLQLARSHPVDAGGNVRILL